MRHEPPLGNTSKDVRILVGPQEIVPIHTPVDGTNELSAIRSVLEDGLSGESLLAIR